MKRIITILLTLLICICAGASASAQTTDKKVSEALRFVRGTGIFIEDRDISESVTRGEFTEILLRMCYKEAGISSGATAFTDIDSVTQSQKEAISAVTSLGYMRGTSETTFEPERGITVTEVAKTLLVVAGYDEIAQARGGTMDVYINLGLQFGVLRNVAASNNACTVGELAQMIYDCRRMKVLDVKSISNENINYEQESSFLTQVMCLSETKGLMSDNGYTSLSGTSSVGENYIAVDGSKLALTENTQYVRHYIGRKIVCYWRIDPKTDANFSVVYAYPTYDDSEKTFDIGKATFSGGKFTYEDENNRFHSINVAKVPYIIYNGMAVSELKDEYLDYEFGTITVLSSGKNTNDIIIIEGYYSAYISDIDYVQEKVYLSRKNPFVPSGNYVIESEKYDDLTVFDAYGQPLTFTSLTPYSVVDICQSAESIKIIIPEDSYKTNVIFTVKSEDSFETADIEYKVSEKYLSSPNALIPNLGELCNFFVNSFGTIVWFDESEQSDESVGCLTETALSGTLSSKLEMRLLTSEGKLLVLKASDKLRIRTADGSTSKYDTQDAYAVLNGYCGLVQYDLNDDNEVSFIGIPVNADGLQTPSALKTIHENDGVTELLYAYKIFANKAVVNNATIMFIINPAESAPEDKYVIGSVDELKGSKSYYVSAYTYEENSPYARYLVVYNDFSDILIDHQCIVVQKVRNTTDSEGEDSIKIEGYMTQTTSNTAGISKVDLLGDSEILAHMSDVVNSGNTYSVKPGDIIRYNLKNGKISNAVLLYRSDMENVNGSSGRRGGIPGSLGYFDADNYQLSNPFIYNETTDPSVFNKGHHRYAFGSIVNMDEQGNITYTTQDLTCSVYDATDPKYVTEVVPKQNNFVTFTADGIEYTVANGGLNDIRTYNDCGSECSRILVKYSYGNPCNLFIIN